MRSNSLQMINWDVENISQPPLQSVLIRRRNIYNIGGKVRKYTLNHNKVVERNVQQVTKVTKVCSDPQIRHSA